MFQKATRLKARARVAIDGPAKAGKSVTGLRLAYSLGKKVAAIDTEFGSLSKYQGRKFDEVTFDFDVNEIRNYSPDTYIGAIKEAERGGYDVLLIDSLSHAWIGEGGILDQKDKSTDRNSFTAWAKLTPQQRKLVDAMLGSEIHIVATMRSKMEYDLVEEINERGKKVRVPVKLGLAPVQREGMEYEFDLLMSMSQDHFCKVTGSRCPEMDGAETMKPGAAFFYPYVHWLSEGSAPPVIVHATPEQIKQIESMFTDENRVRIFAWVKEQYRIDQWGDLKAAEADAVYKMLVDAAAKKAAALAAETAPVTNGHTPRVTGDPFAANDAQKAAAEQKATVTA